MGGLVAWHGGQGPPWTRGPNRLPLLPPAGPYCRAFLAALLDVWSASNPNDTMLHPEIRTQIRKSANKQMSLIMEILLN